MTSGRRPVTDGQPAVANGFDGGTNRRENAPVNPSIAWLREPVSTSLTLGWRLRLYLACLLLVALSVPLLRRSGRSYVLALGPDIDVPVSRARVAGVQAELEAFLAG